MGRNRFDSPRFAESSNFQGFWLVSGGRESLRRLEFHADHPQLFPSLRSGPNHPTAAPSRRNLAVPLGVPRHPVLSVFAAVGARKGGCFAGYALCGFWHPGSKSGYAGERAAQIGAGAIPQGHHRSRLGAATASACAPGTRSDRRPLARSPHPRKGRNVRSGSA